MLDRIVVRLTERGCLLDPEAAEHIARQSQPEAYLDAALSHFSELPLVLTRDQLLALDPLPRPFSVPSDPLSDLASIMPRPAPAPTALVPSIGTERGATPPPIDDAALGPGPPLAAQYAAEVRVLKDSSTSRPSAGDVRDFLQYFNDRLETLTHLLRQRREVANAVRVRDVGRAGKDIQLIGLVTEKSRGPTGHRFVTLEDATGTVDVYVPSDKPELAALFDSLLNDEVIGVVGHPARDGGLLIAQQILRPDIPFQGERPRPEGNLYAGFLSDVHLGSATFLQKEFRAMARWLHGHEGTARERAVARSVKYLVFPGDLVDGVGVYPGQQDALAIEDVFKQYETLAQELAGLPDYIQFVLLPGNHDASRPSEPQPALDKEVRALFDHHDAVFVSNPSVFSLHGIRTLAYHGHSMVDFATTVPGLRMDQPMPVMKQMLQCRHVAPCYGGKTPISPEERDFLVIDQVPDLFVTGHVHVAGLDRYKGVTLVNGGTWQSQTDYQRMHNLVPTPARLPLVNLSTLSGTMIDFSGAD